MGLYLPYPPISCFYSHEELFEDVGGAQGAYGGVVQTIVADDEVKHAVALLAAEAEDAHIAEGHA